MHFTDDAVEPFFADEQDVKKVRIRHFLDEAPGHLDLRQRPVTEEEMRVVDDEEFRLRCGKPQNGFVHEGAGLHPWNRTRPSQMEELFRKMRWRDLLSRLDIDDRKRFAVFGNAIGVKR